MQIVIDIPEDVLEGAKSSPNYYPTYHFEKIWRAIANGTPLPKGHNGKDDVLDKIQGYVDHIRNTGMGKKKSLEFIEKFIEGLKVESEV